MLGSGWANARTTIRIGENIVSVLTYMNDILWKLPVPATALLRQIFEALQKRRCELSVYFEGPSGQQRISLVFEGVEAYKCTYLTSCTADMFNTAYGKLVNLGSTPWLKELLRARAPNSSQVSDDLQHLMICFDDGPCYEIVCLNFKAC